jgi:regulator of sigma D
VAGQNITRIFISQLKIKYMLTINTLAKQMTAAEFTTELDNRNIEWEMDEIDNIMDYNDGMTNIIIDDKAYLFIDGKLNDIAYTN